MPGRAKRERRRAEAKGYWKLYYYFRNQGHPIFQSKVTPSHKELLAMMAEKFELTYEGCQSGRDKLERALACLGDTVVAKTPKTKKRQANRADGERIAFIASDAFLQSYEWRKARYEALKINNGCCCLCGRGRPNGAILNVDHIKPRRTHPELALDIDNLQVLCGDCNHGKGNWDSTDWR